MNYFDRYIQWALSQPVASGPAMPSHDDMVMNGGLDERPGYDEDDEDEIDDLQPPAYISEPQATTIAFDTASLSRGSVDEPSGEDSVDMEADDEESSEMTVSFFSLSKLLY